MKKLNLLFLLMLSFSLFFFVSCNDDDNDGAGNPSYYTIKAVNVEFEEPVAIDSVYAYAYILDGYGGLKDMKLMAKAPYKNGGFELQVGDLTDENYLFSPIYVFVGEDYASEFKLSNASAKSSTELLFYAIKDGKQVGYFASSDNMEEFTIMHFYSTAAYTLIGDMEMEQEIIEGVYLTLTHTCDLNVKKGWNTFNAIGDIDYVNLIMSTEYDSKELPIKWHFFDSADNASMQNVMPKMSLKNFKVN